MPLPPLQLSFDSEEWSDALQRVENAIAAATQDSELHSAARKLSFLLVAHPCRHVCARRSLCVQAIALKGKILHETNDLEGALKALDAAIDLAPDDEDTADVYMARGKVWLDLGDETRAQADIDKATELDPDLRDAFDGYVPRTIAAGTAHQLTCLAYAQRPTLMATAMTTATTVTPRAQRRGRWWRRRTPPAMRRRPARCRSASAPVDRTISPRRNSIWPRRCCNVARLM